MWRVPPLAYCSFLDLLTSHFFGSTSLRHHNKWAWIETYSAMEMGQFLLTTWGSVLVPPFLCRVGLISGSLIMMSQAGWTKFRSGSWSWISNKLNGTLSHLFVTLTCFKITMNLIQYSDVAVSTTTNKLRKHGYIRFSWSWYYSSFHSLE